MKKTIKQELEIIRRGHHGILRPRHVVEYARNPRSTLHSKFCWDNAIAGDKYRLAQARHLINITITIATPEVPAYRAYVSMRRDRYGNGGYRSTVEVMSDDDTRAQLLREALAEFQSMKRRYGHLKELAEIFSAIENIHV